MKVTQKIKLDLTRHTAAPVIDAVQGDSVRWIEIEPYVNGKCWSLPADVLVKVHYCNAAGQGGTYDTLADGKAAWRVEHRKLLIALVPEVCALSGNTKLQVTLTQGLGRISTFALTVCVQGSLEGSEAQQQGTGALITAQAQTVIGRYNVPDENMALILGNGQLQSGCEPLRCNAHTVDWDGNAWFAGTVAVGEQHRILATTQQLDTKISDVFARMDELAASLEYAATLLLHDVSYYTTLNAAVNDANDGTVGANADAAKSDAVAAACIVGGKPYIAMLKDSTEANRLRPAADMTLNLGGHTLSSDDACCIQVSGGTLTIDGRMAGSAIVMDRTTNGLIAQIPAGNGNIVVNGGTYSVNAENGGTIVAFYLLAGVNGTFTNCTISAASDTTKARGIVCEGNLSVADSKITATVAGEHAYGIVCSGTATISNCEIRAYSDYIHNAVGYGYAACSNGVDNNGTLTINDCYVFGLLCGIQNSGTIYVDGGIYEGYGHGGIYFSGEGTTSYVRNAVLRDCDPPEGFTVTHQRNGAGFYIGDDSNISVYMDNCYIWGYNRHSQVIALRGASGEVNNTLYISNSRIDEGSMIRIDDGGHKVYMGAGNNFTAENTGRPDMVVTTDEIYAQAAV